MAAGLYLALFHSSPHRLERAFWIFASTKEHAERIVSELRAKQSIPSSWDTTLVMVPCAVSMGFEGTFREVSL